MPASEFQKKATSFVVVFGLLAVALTVLPLVENWLQISFLPQFGFTFVAGNGWKLTEESAAVMTTATYTNVIENLLSILKIFLWMVLVITVVRFITYVIFLAALRKSGQTEISSLLKTILSIVVYIVAFFIIFQSQYPGINLGAIFTGSAILGVVVGLALQDTLGNLFAGIALQADQPFQVGDVITIPNRGMGVVESVSWRGVKIRTFQNKLLVISNAVLGKESIEVAPKDNLNATLVFFNTLYTASPAKTEQLVREAIRQADNVSPKMRPIVRIRNLGDHGIDWEVKYWLDDYTRLHDTDALIRRNIWYAFQREKVAFAYPTRTIHIEEKLEGVSFEEKVDTNAERLSRVPIFAPLSDEEHGKLAAAATTRIYAPGENIVRKGQEGNSMFVIVRGKVNVQIPEPDGPKVVGTLSENDFFGEMSLLTGENRTATVVAVEETEVLRIGKNALKPVLEINPDLVLTISEIMDKRKSGLVEASKATDSVSVEKSKGVIQSIRKFFGLGS
ncbi:MAG: mechanosensitive ion channel family protein [Pyrinomonadaceae bacterium]|nr:mechanosensitive ion channel family protein [Pyrinomonadaceae bacterium]MBP6213531.1 mechanosensitive ion channel family protein [Pyrinomonadaceae bacterium]